MSKGFNCTTCGKHHLFSAYVFANAGDLLVHTCDVCNAKHDIFNFSATETKPGTKPKTEAA